MMAEARAEMDAPALKAQPCTDARQALLVRALRQSQEELSDAERCFAVWIARQREVMSTLAALPLDTQHEALVAEADRMKSGSELEDLLRSISAFPATLDHALMQIPAASDAGAPDRTRSADGRERLMVKRMQVADGTSVQHEWAPFYAKADAGVLLLFPSIDDSQPSAAVALARYCWEYAGGGQEMTEGLREVHLKAVEPGSAPAPSSTHNSADSKQSDSTWIGAAADKATPGSTAASVTEDTVQATAPATAGAASSSIIGSGGGCAGGHADTLVGRWAGALTQKFRAAPGAAETADRSSFAPNSLFPPANKAGVGGETKVDETTQKQAQQPIVKWWQGVTTSIGKLGKGKQVGGPGMESDSEVWLRAASTQQALRFHDLLQAHCVSTPSAATTSPAATPSGSLALESALTLPAAVDVHVENIPTMKVWELVKVMKEIDVRHEASSAARERFSYLYNSQDAAVTCGGGVPAIELMLPQLCNLALQSQMEVLAEDSEGLSSHTAGPQRSLEVWLVDEMTVNLHLGLAFSWTLDAGAPPELVPSLIPPDSSSSSTLGYTSMQPQSFSGSIPGANLLANGGRQSLNAVGAVGGAALSGVTRGLSFVNVKASSAEVREMRAKTMRRDAYRTLRMRAETAGLAGRRIGKEQSADYNASDAIFERLCREDVHMRETYGAKCPFEPLTVAVKTSKFALDCIKEELSRRKDFIEAQRLLMEQLTRVSALLAGVPKDARAAQMRRMLEDIHVLLPTGAYVPLCNSEQSHEVAVALVYDEAVCLSTFERAPYAVAVETVCLPHTLRNTYSVVRSVELLHYWLHLRLQQEAAEAAAAASSGSEEGDTTPPDLSETFRPPSQSKLLLQRRPLKPRERAQWSRLPSVVTWHRVAATQVEAHAHAKAAATEAEAVFATAVNPNGVEGTSGEGDDGDDAVVLVTPRDSCVTPRDPLDTSSKNQVVDEGVGLGWWWRPRKDIAANGQTGDVSVLDKVFGETWESRSERRRRASIYGSHDGWRLRPLIIKAGDDLRQEQFAMQLISCIQV